MLTQKHTIQIHEHISDSLSLKQMETKKQIQIHVEVYLQPVEHLRQSFFAKMFNG